MTETERVTAAALHQPSRPRNWAWAMSKAVAARAQMTRTPHEVRLLQPAALWKITAQHAAWWRSHIKTIKMTFTKNFVI
ncbi:hypothetical protein [Comamonas flocculans]|uniref:Uncharacterized protein n=1 Tax=Comamonas flocculans TaxID=2597701 RepID=A0A5B8RWH6_9BURK|nr:hypothetical protein [Comamonas flocculans]QEA13936.1 hypothetical protein FOZ74_13390 [Comamonas flocculans]